MNNIGSEARRVLGHLKNALNQIESGNEQRYPRTDRTRDLVMLISAIKSGDTVILTKDQMEYTLEEFKDHG